MVLVIRGPINSDHVVARFEVIEHGEWTTKRAATSSGDPTEGSVRQHHEVREAEGAALLQGNPRDGGFRVAAD